MAVKFELESISKTKASDKYLKTMVDYISDDLTDVASRSGYGDNTMKANLNMNGYSITNTATDLFPDDSAMSTTFEATTDIDEETVHAALVSVDDDILAHTGDTDNPHAVTASDVGLGNVDNTADADKPISDATQDAIDLKATIADTALTTGLTLDGVTVYTSANLIPGNNMRAAYFTTFTMYYAYPRITVGDSSDVISLMAYFSHTVPARTFDAWESYTITSSATVLQNADYMVFDTSFHSVDDDLDEFPLVVMASYTGSGVRINVVNASDSSFTTSRTYVFPMTCIGFYS